MALYANGNKVAPVIAVPVLNADLDSVLEALKALPSYDENKEQTLKLVNGVITWVDN